MKPSKFTIILMLVLVVASVVVFNMLAQRTGNKPIISANVGQILNQPSPSPEDVTPFNTYNPPKEVKYDSGTNLKKELESINPQIFDKDFEELKTLSK